MLSVLVLYETLVIKQFYTDITYLDTIQFYHNNGRARHILDWKVRKAVFIKNV